jgi:hypothetical protein
MTSPATVLIDPWTTRGRGLTSDQIRSRVDEAAPSLWQRYGWLRARIFLDAVETARSERFAGEPENVEPPAWMEGCDLGTVRELLARTSGTVFTMRPVHGEAMDRLLAVLRTRLRSRPYLCAGLIAQSVEGLEPGAHLLSAEAPPEHVAELDTAKVLRVGQGQRWVEGGGGVLFLGLRWSELENQLGDAADAYAEGLVAIGFVGHELVHRLSALGMRARMTPAVVESCAARLFGLDPGDADLLYLLKFGHVR